MKKIIVLLLALASTLSISAQEKPTKNDFFEINSDKTLKFYLGLGFRLSKKKCADYYMICRLDDHNFELKDSVKVYYKDDNLQMKGFYSEGKKNGHFTYYYDNGSPECEGNYVNDVMSGSWSYYYPNGNLKKIIDFTNNYAYLKDFFHESGNQLVENGNGQYIDNIQLYYNTQTKSTVKGEIKDGIQDAKWEIYTANLKTTTEYFQNKKFIKGISHSKLGDTNYFDQFYSSFIDCHNFEILNLASFPICIEPTTKSNVSYEELQEKVKVAINNPKVNQTVETRTTDDLFYKKIKVVFDKSELKNKILNGWFYVEMNFNSHGKYAVNIYSYQDDFIQNELKEIIISSHKKTAGDLKNTNTTKFFPVVIQNGNAFLPTDPGFSLMSIN